ncbi:XRE family transcriptional regulator [Amycolatopsis jiangsuensis]|uniref:Transcriptional regulator with XRE-family HTH domain n=1 Tax=Amycolatopsis jiangsuensis TaxID=1181879 RepID=A0A840J3V3_9PSEU|nr:XRE family transcriptional regulator [Amycolatopsis jiangsuensis]MBB4688543.1 transcriptional regulator with XRE-family HTH domain [Amycolatopsis jiangsuensis]
MQTPPSSGPDARALATAVGSRIRALRTRAGIGLTSLAAGSGLGKGTLSELENGRRNPTLDTLFAIATELSVPLSDLLSGEEVHGDAVTATLLGRWEDPEALNEVYRLTIDARTQLSKPHSPGVREVLTVLTGAAEAGPSAAPVPLRAGETHTFVAEAEHLYRGIGGPASAVLTMRYPR